MKKILLGLLLVSSAMVTGVSAMKGPKKPSHANRILALEGEVQALADKIKAMIIANAQEPVISTESDHDEAVSEAGQRLVTHEELETRLAEIDAKIPVNRSSAGDAEHVNPNEEKLVELEKTTNILNQVVHKLLGLEDTVVVDLETHMNGLSLASKQHSDAIEERITAIKTQIAAISEQLQELKSTPEKVANAIKAGWATRAHVGLLRALDRHPNLSAAAVAVLCAWWANLHTDLMFM